VKPRIEDGDHRDTWSHHGTCTLDPGDAPRIMQWRKFGQTINRGNDAIVDPDRLVKLLASMHHSVSEGLDAKSPSFLPARLL
jgi:hypothetical protein